MTQARIPFADLPPAQQAGILCNDPEFQRFAALRAKPLEWKKFGTLSFPEFCATTVVGDYFAQCDDETEMWFASFEGADIEPQILGAGDMPTADQAKAAAQAHADQLVADMAQPVTPQDAAQVLLMVDDVPPQVAAWLNRVCTAPPQEKDDE